MFSYSFKNKPCKYHNGARWPMITGFTSPTWRNWQAADGVLRTGSG